MRLPFCDKCGKLIQSGQSFTQVTMEQPINLDKSIVVNIELCDDCLANFMASGEVQGYGRVYFQRMGNVKYTLPTPKPVSICNPIHRADDPLCPHSRS